jgi:hypothetical protein
MFLDPKAKGTLDRLKQKTKAHLRAHQLSAELISTAITERGANQNSAWKRRVD